MSTPWTYLLRRYGEDIASPSIEDIKQAIHETYHENLSGMTLSDYEEHGAMSLRFGYDEGPMYVLELTRTKLLTLESWKDQDYMDELCAPRVLTSVSENRAVELLLLLAGKNIKAVEAEFATDC